MMSTLLEKLPVAARWLIIVGIAYTLADTFRFVLASPASVSEEASVVTPREAGLGIPGEVTLQRIQARNLFGALGAMAEPSETVPPPRETALALQLRGVFVSDSPDSSVAIVAMPNQRGQLYAVGDMLPGEVELVAVLADHVLLSNGGVRETLAFPVARPGTGPSALVSAVTGDDLYDIPPLQPVSTVDEHPDRWEPGFSTVLGMVAPGSGKDE